MCSENCGQGSIHIWKFCHTRWNLGDESKQRGWTDIWDSATDCYLGWRNPISLSEWREFGVSFGTE
jgi:hypothetical protein